MNLFRTVAVAFSLFSRVPMPHIRWDEKNMRYMLCAFPLIGIVIGLLLWGWCELSAFLGFGGLLFAAGITLLPILVTGGIHLDGFCDVGDALASHGSPERKREILKDPHIGAFGVIGLCVYLLAYFALASELELSRETAWLLGLGCILSRTLSGLSVICFKGSGGSGMASTFKAGSAKKRAAAVLFICFAVVSGVMIWFFWPAGCAMVFAALFALFILRITSKRQFGGMSGDLAGWFLQLAELLMLAAMVITERVVSL